MLVIRTESVSHPEITPFSRRPEALVLATQSKRKAEVFAVLLSILNGTFQHDKTKLSNLSGNPEIKSVTREGLNEVLKHIHNGKDRIQQPYYLGELWYTNADGVQEVLPVYVMPTDGEKDSAIPEEEALSKAQASAQQLLVASNAGGVSEEMQQFIGIKSAVVLSLDTVGTSSGWDDLVQEALASKTILRTAILHKPASTVPEDLEAETAKKWFIEKVFPEGATLTHRAGMAMVLMDSLAQKVTAILQLTAEFSHVVRDEDIKLADAVYDAYAGLAALLNHINNVGGLQEEIAPVVSYLLDNQYRNEQILDLEQLTSTISGILEYARIIGFDITALLALVQAIAESPSDAGQT